MGKKLALLLAGGMLAQSAFAAAATVLRADQPQAQERVQAILGQYYDQVKDRLPFATLVVADQPIGAIGGTIIGLSNVSFFWIAGPAWESPLRAWPITPMLVTNGGFLTAATRQYAQRMMYEAAKILGKKVPSGSQPWVDFIYFQDGSTWGEDHSGQGKAFLNMGNDAADILESIKGLPEPEARKVLADAESNTQEAGPEFMWRKEFRLHLRSSANFAKAVQDLERIKGGGR